MWGKVVPGIGLAYLLMLSIEDIKYKKIKINHLVMGIPVIIVNVVLGIKTDKLDYMELLMGLVLALVICVLGALVKGLGQADVVLIFMLALVLGIRRLLVCMMISWGLVYVVAGVMLCKRKLRRKTTFPYIPFLSVGAVIAIL